ncbi:DUF3961 domain-containing protein [Anaerophaga thermohalophila]
MLSCEFHSTLINKFFTNETTYRDSWFYGFYRDAGA